MYNRILIIRLSSLGDVVLTQPVTAVLKKRFPKAEIHFITKKAYLPVVECFNCVDKVYIWEEYKSYSKLRKLAKQKFDLVIDLHNKFNTFLIKKVVHGKKTITYNKQHRLRRKIIKQKTDKVIKSTVDLYFSALRKIGIESVFDNPILYPNEKLSNDFTGKIKSEKIKLAIFPGALHKTKQYPVDLLLEVINKLNDKYQIFLSGSKSEKDLAKKIVNKVNKSVYDLTGELTISEMLTFLSIMDVIISNDSGPMHIAAALNKNQIAIFGATHPKLGFAPLNNKAIVLKADLHCQPCSLHGGSICPKLHFNCMKMIEPEQIMHYLNKVILDRSSRN
ncbi:MAG: glycosyltransferase family 9 protein [Candidatus Cloacimonetes bacterium]|nr:glycosyltransferase family 9 protein [Candidatus Cloacimonadota bacterium]MCF7815002.1 glycosyltransferase family 9 protein [Candidatus Cloacimonadota bacterium]MCF7869245.1 glycosyltransferase family 9 protein [Candidatus Cloacimonadota bacterium]MCF7884679.1 glycosyltransferase family 9 protein [Candidatus Cloacimonadota bacterium]